MHKNVLLRSMLRQRMRTVVLVLLIASASFSFVLRAAEYTIITDRINTIGGFYRSIGFLLYTGHSHVLVPDNVFAGAEIIRRSPLVEFEDRRRGFSGVLRNMQNADIQHSGGNILPNSPSDPYELHQHNQLRHNDAFFYANLISKDFYGSTIIEDAGGHFPPHIRMVFLVDYVLQGYSEHVSAGQEIILRYILSEMELETGETSIDNMMVGERYFLRSSYYWITMRSSPAPNPDAGLSDVVLTMVPLNLEISLHRRYLESTGIWYIPAAVGESVNSSTPDLEMLDEILKNLKHSQSLVYLRTTADMTALPIMQLRNPPMWLDSGRWLSHEDYKSAANAALVHTWFAQMRNLELGDVITVQIPREQIVIGATSDPGQGLDVGISSIPHGYVVYELELEIVGLFRSVEDRIQLAGGATTYNTSFTPYIYIPDSILPHDFVFLPNPQGSTFIENSPDLQMVHEMSDDPDFLPHSWYSFVLSDPRDETSFLLQYRDALGLLGFSIHFFEQGAEQFWTSAESILQAVLLNAVIFCAVSILVLVLVMFLYFRQRKREFAILRALGVSEKKAAGQLLVSVMYFGIPAIIIGSAGGWFLARNQAANTLNPLADITAYMQIDLSISVSVIWFFVLTAVIIAVLFAMSLAGVLRINRRPVLEQIQDAAGGK